MNKPRASSGAAPRRKAAAKATAATPAADPPPATLPFAGLRVIEVATFIAAPAAATMLSDLGADVVKIEMPGGGDPWRHQSARPELPRSDVNYLWHLTSRNKRSLVLDLKTRAAQGVLQRLVDTADIFITNMPPAIRPRLGIGYDTLAEANPRLIYGSLSGYGELGGDNDEKAYDTTAWWGRCGAMEQLRAEPEGPPVRPPLAMGDHTAALALFGALSAALFHRERTGKGSYVGSSLLAAGAWVNGPLIQAGLAGARFAPKRARSQTPNPMQCHYRCADDRWVMLIVGFDPQEANWPKLARCLGLERLLADERFATYAGRDTHCTELIAALDAAFRIRSAADWLPLVRQAGFTIELVNSPADAAADPQMVAGGVVVPLAGVEGMAQVVGSPVWFRDLPRRPAGRGPALNEHAEEVLRGCGYSASEIGGLTKAGVVG